MQIRAAFDGILSDVALVAGGRVQAGEKLGAILDPSALEVQFRLSTRTYARLLGAGGALIPARVTVALDLGGAEIATTGQLARVGAAVGDGQTGRLIFATLQGARGFQPGDFATVRIAEPELADVALLPAASVGTDGAVLVLGPEDRLALQPVEVLRRQGDSVIVAAAVLAGREVVTERTPLLGAGIRINPIRPDAMGASPDDRAEAGVALCIVMSSGVGETDLASRARAIALPERGHVRP